ncbi:MAG: ATP-binding cassette domain-containing protein [Chitinivibrionales bacterium]|nr:ATP-binding cassette domain-containing protein [Chitinivibrionales bacterium]
MPAKISARDISFFYDATPIARQVSFSVEEGRMLIIAGKSGSGKSTLLEICAGLVAPQQGQVFIDGHNLAEAGPKEMLDIRKRMGYVFQKHALVSNMTVYDNIALPLRYHLHLTEGEVQPRVMAMLELFGIRAVSAKRPEVLSVGQARCGSIARALIMDPDLLFLDEPTSGLDPVTTESLVGVLNEIRQRKHLTVLMVSHDVLTMQQLKAPVAVLENGRLIDSTEASGDGPAPKIVSYLKEAL